MKLDPMSISVRDLTEEDIPYVLNYWFYSPPDFIEAMGVDKEKLGIRVIGEEIIDFGIIKAGARAKIFELKREEICLTSPHAAL